MSQSIGNWSKADRKDVVLLGDYVGGGFGGKNPETHMHTAIPALLAKKTGRPVMMRISREDDHFIGRARAGMVMRVRMGFRKDGRMVALDMFVVQANGPYGRGGDYGTCAVVASANYTPLNMRFRGTAVLTNTPPHGPQRGPGGAQSTVMFEPLMCQAARKLGIDEVEIRKINAPTTGMSFGVPEKNGERPHFTSAFAREALERGAEKFNWAERKKRNGQMRGSKVTGVGVSLANFTAGTIGFDGMIAITSEGKLNIYSGVGNIGTLSVYDTARVAAEMLDMPWDKCEVIWGDTSRHLPWSSRQGGSQTIHATSRANYAAALDAKLKLQKIAAKDLGGSPDDYTIGNQRVFRKANPASGMSFGQAAQRAITLGGQFDGHEVAKDLNTMTKESAKALAGIGLMGVAKDNYGRKGATQSFVVGFAEVEVDIETGEYKVLDFLCVADCGTVVNPRGLEGQLHGGAIQGIGYTRSQKWVYDQQYGVALAKRFHYNRPPSILDIPEKMEWDAVNLPDSQTPIGAKGIAEAAVGAGAGTVRCALAAAIGDDYVRRTPVGIDMILASVEAKQRVDQGLTSNV